MRARRCSESIARPRAVAQRRSCRRCLRRVATRRATRRCARRELPRCALRASFARGGRGAQSREDQRLGLAVRDTFADGDLCVRRTHIFSQLDSLEQRFVGVDREKNRRTPSVLCQHERSLGALDLLNERRDACAEFGEWANVLAGAAAAHDTSSGTLYKITYTVRRVLSSGANSHALANNAQVQLQPSQ